MDSEEGLIKLKFGLHGAQNLGICFIVAVATVLVK